MKIIDISVPLYPGMATYPGDPTVEFRPWPGKDWALTEITLGTHTGTHADAPRHVFKNGARIDELPLEKFVGPCRVLDMTHVKHAIELRDLQAARIKKGERILVKTRNSLRSPEVFRPDYVYLSGDATQYLAKLPITLFGIDAFSVKQRGSGDRRPHTVLLKKKIVILERLALQSVKAGAYFLAALPLRLRGLDGSPVRAILLQGKGVSI
ncbi:cyclase family protein [Candidatus Uhrbacteria bacterium]|nr:cyclase family protein [Candidatus Uhrbacteria bacterium]